MKPIKSMLKIYQQDNVTVEERYFSSISLAKKYVKQNRIVNYKIERRENQIVLKVINYLNLN